MNSNHLNSLNQLSKLYKILFEKENLLFCLKKIEELNFGKNENENSLDNFITIGKLETNFGNFENAIESYQKGIELNEKKNFFLYLHQSLIYELKLKNFEKCLECLNSYLLFDSNSITVLESKSRILEKMELKSKELIENEKKILKLINQSSSMSQKYQETLIKISNLLMKENEFKEAIEYLNEIAGTNFRWNSRKSKALITARYNEDWLDIKDYQLVVDKKCQEWLNDGEFERYLQPSTLFGPKFGQYHGQKWTGTPGQRDWSKKHGGSY